MAVQAQHPSHVFFLNRNGQEGNDCSLQPQKPHFPFVNGGVDTRKRAREFSSVNNNIEVPAASMNPPPPRPPQLLPQVIDLSQLQHQHRHRQPPNVVSTGLRLSSGDRNGQLQQYANQEQLSSSSFPVFTGDFAGEIKRQTDELDRFLETQGEELRRTLAENRQRHYRELLCAAEEILARRLREKDAEMEKATRHNAELEARAAQLEAEARVWQVRATAREAEAASLQARLQQALASSRGTATATTGEQGGAEEAEDAESAYVDPDRVEVPGPSCKVCRRRLATVVALPCRHLCLCIECDGASRACPLCLSLKNSSVEVFLA